MKSSWIFIITLVCLHVNMWAQSTATQTVRGTVVDKESQAPLVGATIVIQGSDPVIGAYSDETGTFRFNRVPIGRHTFVIRYLGYEIAVLPEILVESGKQTILPVSLTESTQELDEVVITAGNGQQPTNEMALVSEAV